MSARAGLCALTCVAILVAACAPPAPPEVAAAQEGPAALAADPAPDPALEGDFEAHVCPRALKAVDPRFRLSRSTLVTAFSVPNRGIVLGHPDPSRVKAFLFANTALHAALDDADEVRIVYRGVEGDALVVMFGVDAQRAKLGEGPETLAFHGEPRGDGATRLTNGAGQEIWVTADGTWIAASREASGRADALARAGIRRGCGAVLARGRARGALLTAYLTGGLAVLAPGLTELEIDHGTEPGAWTLLAHAADAAAADLMSRACTAMVTSANIGAPDAPTTPHCRTSGLTVSVSGRVPPTLHYGLSSSRAADGSIQVAPAAAPPGT